MFEALLLAAGRVHPGAPGVSDHARITGRRRVRVHSKRSEMATVLAGPHDNDKNIQLNTQN